MAADPSQPDRPPSPTFDQLQALLDRSLAQHSAIVDSWMSAAPSSSSQRGTKQGEDVEEVRKWRMRPARLGLGAPMPTQERQHQSTSLSQLNKHLSVGKKRKRSHSPDPPGRASQKGAASRTRGSDSEEEESRSRMLERGRKSNVGAGKKARGVFDLPAGQGKGQKVVPPPVSQVAALASLSFGPPDVVQIDPSADTNTAALGDGKTKNRKKKKQKNGEVAAGPGGEEEVASGEGRAAPAEGRFPTDTEERVEGQSAAGEPPADAKKKKRKKKKKRAGDVDA